jgi:hypothetical protein
VSQATLGFRYQPELGLLAKKGSNLESSPMMRLKFVDFIAESNNLVDVQIGESFTIELLSLNHNSMSWKILGIKYVFKR